MTYAVTAPCFGCKYNDCVVVCRCGCFHEGEQMHYIDPLAYTDCDACRAECPVNAIYFDFEVPNEWQDFSQLNAEMPAKTAPITKKRTPLAQGP